MRELMRGDQELIRGAGAVIEELMRREWAGID
jgi:hypothetical protein